MDSKSKVEFVDKYLGALLGAMVGDALGWVYEDRGMNTGKYVNIQRNFVSWSRRAGGRYQPHEEYISAGSYSDDTQLIFASARSLQYKNWFSHFVKIELPSWLLYERGGGGATKRAAETWSNGHPPWKLEKQNVDSIKRYFNAGGNGVTMRIMPHVFFCKNRLEELTNQVFLNGIATHGHPRALLSAIVFSWAMHYLVQKENNLEYGELVSYLLDNKDNWGQFPKVNNIKDWKEASNFAATVKYDDLWVATANELVSGLELISKAMKKGLRDSKMETLEKLNCFDKSTRGAGTVATLVAIYMASKYAADPASAVMDLASMQNADTDTIASMTGSLLGAIHGTEWIYPEWYLVQDYDYARKLVHNVGQIIFEDTNETLWNSSDNRNIKESIPNLKRADSISIGPFSSVTLQEVSKNKTSSKNFNISTYQFKSDEGQTIYIKIIKKISERPDVKQIQGSIEPQQKNSIINKEPIKVILSDIDIEKLSGILPPRVTAIKLFALISDFLQEKGNIQKLITKHESKTLNVDNIKQVLALLENNLIKSEK
ncbi:ADP-ribosylglycohydrolase family protein [Paenibacillus protaetiae]|nr:ADP-ribosylglycohydrolase family protein [Paenibacillus protaetiae]